MRRARIYTPRPRRSARRVAGFRTLGARWSAAIEVRDGEHGFGALRVLKHTHPWWTGDVRVLIYCHGGLGGSVDDLNVADDLWFRFVSEQGGRYVIVAADDGVAFDVFSNGMSFGNEQGRRVAWAARKWAYGQWRHAKVGWIGYSAGALTAVGMADRRPEHTAGVFLVDGMASVTARLLPDPTLESYLDNAHGTAWANVDQDIDPTQLATAHAWLRALPCTFVDANTDSTFPDTNASDLATAWGANFSLVTATGDHQTVHDNYPASSLATVVNAWSWNDGPVPPLTRNPRYRRNAGLRTR